MDTEDLMVNLLQSIMINPSVCPFGIIYSDKWIWGRIAQSFMCVCYLATRSDGCIDATP